MKILPATPISAFLITLLFTIQPAQAQILGFGIKGGANLSTFSAVDNADYLAGLHFGMYFNIKPPLTPVAIQPEFLYTQLGSVYNYRAPSIGNQVFIPGNLRINYLQIPVLLKYYLPFPPLINPNIFAGPYIGYSIHSRFDHDDEIQINIEDHIHDTDYGFVLGLGTDFNFLVRTLQIDARYIHGLQSVFHEDFIVSKDKKNRAFALSIGFSL